MEFVSSIVLTEVINLNFALPIVGVILCAFLVYAFGFKSSSSPPSFDFQAESDLKKARKSKKPKKQTPNNLSTDVKTETISRKQVTKHNIKPDKESSPIATKLKAKKVTNTSKTHPQVKKIPETNDLKEYEGEWTQAISRKKQNKQRNKKDEPVKIENIGSNVHVEKNTELILEEKISQFALDDLNKDNKYEENEEPMKEEIPLVEEQVDEPIEKEDSNELSAEINEENVNQQVDELIVKEDSNELSAEINEEDLNQQVDEPIETEDSNELSAEINEEDVNQEGDNITAPQVDGLEKDEIVEDVNSDLVRKVSPTSSESSELNSSYELVSNKYSELDETNISDELTASSVNTHNSNGSVNALDFCEDNIDIPIFEINPIDDTPSLSLDDEVKNVSESPKEEEEIKLETEELSTPEDIPAVLSDDISQSSHPEVLSEPAKEASQSVDTVSPALNSVVFDELASSIDPGD